MSIRCKAICTGITDIFGTTNSIKSSGAKISESLSFTAVYSTDPNSENKWFSKATPLLTITMTIDNPKAFGMLKQGCEYYIDFKSVYLHGPGDLEGLETSCDP